MKPTKIDQHFIVDEDVLSRVLELSDLTPNDTVLEIGAGTGTLTEKLTLGAKKVYSIEIDRQLEPILSKLVTKHKNLEVLWGNALEVPWPRFDKMVSNLPYSISEPVLQKLVHCDFCRAILLCSEHFARILTGERRTKLTLEAGVFFEIRPDILVYPSSFEPEPKVNSRIVVIEPKTPRDPKEAIMREFLLQRDKLAKNALREAIIRGFGQFGTELTKRQAKEKSLGLDLNKKVYALSLDEIEAVQEYICDL